MSQKTVKYEVANLFYSWRTTISCHITAVIENIRHTVTGFHLKTQNSMQATEKFGSFSNMQFLSPYKLTYQSMCQLLAFVLFV